MKTMKKMLFGISMAAAIASPALAQNTRQHSSDHRAAAQHQQMLVNQPMQNAYGAGIVTSAGKIVGQDPDSNVQLGLRRDTIQDY